MLYEHEKSDLFGKPSPTKAEHVIEDLDKKLDIIIDGGETKIGLESTIIDLTTTPPTLLRPGFVTTTDLKKIIGKFAVHPIVRGGKLRKITARAPGMKYRHYAPNAMIILVEGKYKKEGKGVGVMTTSKNYSYRADAVKFSGNEPEVIAKNLFKTFREFDKEKIDVVMAEGILDRELGLAVMNRLRKASRRIMRV